ncbi:MAG: alpha/beta fold hydrolase [Anaerolineae bacterium]
MQKKTEAAFVPPASRSSARPLQTLASTAMIGTGVAVLGWLAYSAFFINHNRSLPEALEAERRTYASRVAGILSYYVSRENKAERPLVLLHSINAAASAYEMRPIFEHYRKHRPIYVLDLPGFGYSDRANRAYSPHLYTEAITDFLRTQVKEQSAVDVIALSLSAEFAAMAALAMPEKVRSLAFISPTGLDRRARGMGSEIAYRIMTLPLWSQGVYDLLVTKASIKFFLEQSFEGAVDDGLLEYALLTTHRPGARYAPLCFVSGKLFTPNILQNVYTQLPMPVLVLHDYDAFTGFDALPTLAAQHPNWQVRRIVPTRGLPHFERMSDVAEALNAFWERLPAI